MNSSLPSIRKTTLIITGILFVTLACGLPFDDNAGQNVEPVVLTANALSTSVVATQTAMAEGVVSQITSVDTGTDGVQETASAMLTQAAEQITQEPTLPTTLAHNAIPGEPGPAKQVLNDESSAATANQKFAPAGSESYRLYNRLERPFNADMSYRPDLDIEKAEIFTDGNFIYITMYLNNTNPSTQTFTADYGVEIDTDNDGRGDFLIWTHAPQTTTWSIDAVSVIIDTNNDVGAKTILMCDAPTTGDGYDVLFFSLQNPGKDPDAAWSRIAPSAANTIQIAFKNSILDTSNTFMWTAWADDGLKNPGMFDYNDRFTEAEAGSPMDKNEFYSIKGLFAVDSTCRMVFGRAVTGSEPGVCGNTETIKITQQIDATKIINLTPPVINFP